jgi:nitrogen regulatory protein P-II 1
MTYRKVTAIIDIGSLEAVERAVQHVGTFEVAVTRVKGYGNYRNFYNAEWLSEQARVEVFARQEQAAALVEAICRAAYTGKDSHGMVAVLPVEAIHRIKDYLPPSEP